MIQSTLRTRGDTALMTFRFTETLSAQDVSAMARNVESAMGTHAHLRLILDFSDLSAISPSAFASLQGTVTSAKSIGPVERYAVVGAPDLAAKAVELFGRLLPLDARSFEETEQADALEWAFARKADI